MTAEVVDLIRAAKPPNTPTRTYHVAVTWAVYPGTTVLKHWKCEVVEMQHVVRRGHAA
jgi:hypothetical protein